MRKEDFERALGSLDDSLIGEIAEKDRKMIKKERKPARILRRRVWLIPAVALLLVAAILVPTLVVMNQKPEEPAVPAVNETTVEELKTEEVKSEEAVKQTEAPVETTAPLAGETNETVAGRTGYVMNCGGRDTWCDHLGSSFLIVKIENITKEVRNDIDTLDTEFTKVEYDCLYANGTYERYYVEDNQLKSYYPSVADYVGEKHPDLYMSSKALENVCVGDTILCNVWVRSLFGGYDKLDYKLYVGLVGLSLFKFVDGELIDCTGFHYGRNEEILKAPFYYYEMGINDIKNMKKDGYDFVNKELIEQMPEVKIGNGMTVEEVIQVMTWFEEVHKVVVVKYIPFDIDNVDLTKPIGVEIIL